MDHTHCPHNRNSENGTVKPEVHFLYQHMNLKKGFHTGMPGLTGTPQAEPAGLPGVLSPLCCAMEKITSHISNMNPHW